MADVGSETIPRSPLGQLNYTTITATDVQTDGSSTVAADMRKVFYVGHQNLTRAAAGGLKIAVSGGTLTLTAETADDDFELYVVGV